MAFSMTFRLFSVLLSGFCATCLTNGQINLPPAKTQVAAESGDMEAQVALGNWYKNGNLQTNKAEAVRWYRRAAEQGHAVAQYELGFCYESGQGVTKDEVEAVRWYRKAAEQGHAAAQNNVGVRYDSGQGVAKDEMEAARWFRKAADQGYAVAQFNLAMCYNNGLGVTKDEAQAVAWYRKAAEQNHAKAQNNLAWHLSTSANQMIRNGEEATRWAESANQLTNFADYNKLGTLAAAYAEAGRFDKAIEFQQKSLDLAKQESEDRSEGHTSEL